MPEARMELGMVVLEVADWFPLVHGSLPLFRTGNV